MYVSGCHQKLTRLRYVTLSLANLHWYRHFLIRYEFYAAVQIQTIIQTESASFSRTNVAWTYAVIFQIQVKEKERKSIYIATFCTKVHTKRSGMDHTVLPANNTMPAFPSWRSPDGAAPN